MGELRAPWWAWLATAAAAVAAVLGVQLVAVSFLESPPRFLSDYREPAIITAVHELGDRLRNVTDPGRRRRDRLADCPRRLDACDGVPPPACRSMGGRCPRAAAEFALARLIPG